jgi:ATP-dependent Clp protease protease subunit
MGTIYGSASEVEIRAKDIVRTREKINRLYAHETGHSYDEIVKATDRDNWMSAEEAKSFGLIKKIIKARSELPV